MAFQSLPQQNLLAGKFVSRENRFLAIVDVDGKQLPAHVPSSGRMRELLVPGATVWVNSKAGKGRKTAYELSLVLYNDVLVSIDARLPNELVRIALQEGLLRDFAVYSHFRQEYTFESSRCDFFLPGNPPCLLEVKSVTLVEGGQALFPDAPTERGRKHLHDLMVAVQKELRAAVVFIIQREDACCFSPNDKTDPEFGQLLRLAAQRGVEIKALKCNVKLTGVTIGQEIPVRL